MLESCSSAQYCFVDSQNYFTPMSSCKVTVDRCVTLKKEVACSKSNQQWPNFLPSSLPTKLWSASCGLFLHISRVVQIHIPLCVWCLSVMSDVKKKKLYTKKPIPVPRKKAWWLLLPVLCVFLHFSWAFLSKFQELSGKGLLQRSKLKFNKIK